MRLFVALELPASHRLSLNEVCERGKRDGVRWVAAENVHLTLKFLGEVDLVPEVKTALASAAAAARPFELSLAGGGCFPNARDPRVIWVGVEEGAGETSDLARAVEQALKPLGFKPERRRFRPHLTIGRPKGRKESASAAAAKIEQLQGFSTPPATAEAITLIKSTLTPDGAVYEEITRVPLGRD